MKARVLQVFVDSKKKCIYSVGQIIEVSKERYKEMNATSLGLLVEEIEEIKDEQNVGNNEE